MAQSFLMLITDQVSSGGALQGLAGTGGVVELAVGVVVEHEQGRDGLVSMTG